MTANELKAKAKEFNAEYFNSEIDFTGVTFKVSTRMTKIWGLCRYKSYPKSFTVTLSAVILCDEVFTEQTLIHELVHVLEIQKYGSASHGSFFKSMGRTIGKLSEGKYSITRTSDSTPAVAVVLANRMSQKNQYLLSKNGRVNFLRKLSVSEVIHAKAHGFNVYKVKNPTERIRHAKSFIYAVTPRRYYPEAIINKLELSLKEL